jgi:hypothetical protein
MIAARETDVFVRITRIAKPGIEDDEKRGTVPVPSADFKPIDLAIWRVSHLFFCRLYDEFLLSSKY